ncbi:hypothetical protein GGR50DRAFT_671446 [Xylaria sp. CBS 124048]|nr:hypothetical protein GGR50DRAFT_671446 [Xylaria sp. CBS 124048]
MTMATTKAGVDLERELNCSICTELLFQPLTLLDCLHTFCGSCLKDWFEFQKISAESSPTPPAPGAIIFTCPSCRAAVRDTRRNATVTSLLDIFLASNPDKVRPKAEQDELREKYKPDDNVLPRLNIPERSAEERRADQLDRQLIDQAREMSLRDAGVETSSRRRREHSRSDGGSRAGPGRDRSRGDQETRHHARREDERRDRASSNRMLHPGLLPADERRHHRSQSRHSTGMRQSRDSSVSRTRHVEHQASIRSLINSSNIGSRDLEREIDELARQIQAEGLLDGLDLDNLDLSHNDELSRKITEAYRRQQRERMRAGTRTRSHPRTPSSQSQNALPLPRPAVTDTLRPGTGTSSRPRSSSMHTRGVSLGNQIDDRSRRNDTSTTRLGAHIDYERQQGRRTSSTGARSANDATRPSTSERRPAARSRSSDPSSRQSSSADRQGSVDMPAVEIPSGGPLSGPGEQFNDDTTGLSFRGRAAATIHHQNPVPPPLFSTSDNSSSESTHRRRAPSLVAPQHPLPSLGLITSPTLRAHQHQARSQYYQEPSISCSRCQRTHIEYEIHYNCAQCAGGRWNICRKCYREGKGCHHWYGFGYAAMKKWERQRATVGYPLDPPHLLTANRYLPPHSTPGGAEGRKTLTTEDPSQRLESGLFCTRCSAWTNECHWRCDVCNEGDWGFCHPCVNQGYICTHPLLPLTYVPSPSPSPSPLASPALHGPSTTPPGSPGEMRAGRPRAATLFKGPNATIAGNYRPLTFMVTCDICREHIPPSDHRYHCNACTSSIVPEAQPGDYDVCVECYHGLVRDGRLSSDNGPTGWRRCLHGHRMSMVGFVEEDGGQRRVVLQDIVGGYGLSIEAHEIDRTLQRWCWYVNGSKIQRLATVDVAASPPEQLRRHGDEFPPDGGAGSRGAAVWSWYPAPDADDELMFPRGAEVREIEDVNGDWCFGSYMGAKGLFPTPYVRISSPVA